MLLTTADTILSAGHRAKRTTSWALERLSLHTLKALKHVVIMDMTPTELEAMSTTPLATLFPHLTITSLLDIVALQKPKANPHSDLQHDSKSDPAPILDRTGSGDSPSEPTSTTSPTSDPVPRLASTGQTGSNPDSDPQPLLEAPDEQPEGGCDGLVTLLFTSGSNGPPKGVCVSAKAFYADISERAYIEPHVTASYIPLSHSSDRMKLWEFLINGGRYLQCAMSCPSCLPLLLLSRHPTPKPQGFRQI